jgi:beta-lactamase class A
MIGLTRRAGLASGLAATLCRPAAAQPGDGFQALEARYGGRLGVTAIDTGSGRHIAHRATERFALCSTHKLLCAAAILAMVDRGAVTLDHQVSYGPADLLAYAPITKQNLAAGFMTLGALCVAAVQWSDNTAANLLLAQIGGPPGWTRYARSVGDRTSRLDRTEPALNTAIPHDPRDTTTPAAMAQILRTVFFGHALTPASRTRLEDWLLASTITGTLMRAGLPPAWRVADKSGSGDNATRNDIGLIRPAGAAPILAAIYYTGSTQPPAAQDQVIAEATRLIAAASAR